MAQHNASLVGSIVERKSGQASAPTLSTSGLAGFPPVQHRSKSSFARSREARKAEVPRDQGIPAVVPSAWSASPRPAPSASDADDWRTQISRENEKLVDNMTEEERERERQEILERFGSGIGDILKRVRDARGKQKASTNGDREQPSTFEEVPITSEATIRSEPGRVASPPPALSRSQTRPSSRADRRLRFAELSPDDVHVYESAPPSPRRKILALPSPTEDDSTVSLGQWKGKFASMSALPLPQTKDSITKEEDLDEGSPEYIRRRFFPAAPANDPNLAWMDSAPPTTTPATSPGALRFDLSGNPIPPALSESLPTHLGLHHHADGSHAGYTLDDIFLLSRSTVPAQRSSMLGILSGLTRNLAHLKDRTNPEMEELWGREEEVRKRIVGAAAAAVSERGSVGARAIALLWECVVGWDESLASIEGTELQSPTDAALASLPLEFLLPQLVTIFAQRAVSKDSLILLLSILHRLAQQSNEFARAIVTTPRLVEEVMQALLLTSIPPQQADDLPNPSVIQLLITLASSSRENALSLRDAADSLLRFVALPVDSVFTPSLATNLLSFTFRFYTILASYGMYSQIASTAMGPLASVARYVTSTACVSRQLRVSWVRLLEAWMVCAVDPHQTTPPHEILWSQVVGLDWYGDIRVLSSLLSADGDDWTSWGAVWGAQSAWLEGSKVNSPKGGDDERLAFLQGVTDWFSGGIPGLVVVGVVDKIRAELVSLGTVNSRPDFVTHLRDLSSHATVLASVLRLWLACLPPQSTGPLDTPPFMLPIPDISEVSAMVVNHLLWKSPWTSDPAVQVHYRPITTLLSYYLLCSRHLPGISEDLWMAQALCILARLVPGDEIFAGWVANTILDMVTQSWASSRGLKVAKIFWDNGGMSVLHPFLAQTIRPEGASIVGPLISSPHSIQATSTMRLSSDLTKYGLPLQGDWTLTPLNHLLRSGSSPVFKSLPETWKASETDITVASLFLARISRELLRRFSLFDFSLTPNEAAFGCMRVFMLEHDQPHHDSSEEVFRNLHVRASMQELLKTYTLSASLAPSASSAVIPTMTTPSIETVAARFLGVGTPFYQYYTDFVGLYDAISFSDPIFAQLLLVPTSMDYAVDYRRHLWCDYGHVLRTIRTPINEIICGNLRVYLTPIEHDAQILGAYLRHLIKGPLREFVRFVALHHIATNVWPDLHRDGGWSDEKASKLLLAVVDQGDMDTVREVVVYNQTDVGLPLVPPACFERAKEVRETREACLRRWGGEALVTRLEKLFI